MTLLAVCGTTHRESYFDIVMVGIVGALIALVVVIVLGIGVRFVLNAHRASMTRPRICPSLIGLDPAVRIGATIGTAGLAATGCDRSRRLP